MVHDRTECDPDPTNVGADTEAAGTTARKMRSMLEEHGTLLIQDVERITMPIMARLQVINGLITRDINNLIQ